MKRQYASDHDVPKIKRYRGLQKELDEFMARPETTMILTWEPGDSYKTEHTMYASYKGATIRSGYPIDVVCRNGAVYLIKKKFNSQRSDCL